jgi:serine/threonine protein kinase
MSERSLSNPESLPLSVEKRVDDACDRFEAAWKAGQNPAIENYLAGVPEPERTALLRALLGLEVGLRWEDDERPTPAEYEQRFPHDLELIQAAFAEARDPDDEVAQNGIDECTTIDETPRPAEPPPVLPDRIGRYKVCRRLGGGTFGDVYLANDELMKRQVAIKVPSLRLLASQSARDQFLAEARSVASLQHEGIVRAYDFGQEADGKCYIVYELIEGTNLAERILPKRLAAEPLTPDQAARIVAQVAEALHYAHLKGLVHRDVKPANILLDRQAKPRITDLGLAVREEDLPKERGRLAGTLPYMSPEQVRRENHHIDGRTDIYSLGVILYELLCGRRPFTAKTVKELEDQILHREAKPPRQINDGIPQELERVCLKALSKRVQDRYATAKDMTDEILRAIDSTESERDPSLAISPEELERRMASADEHELRRLLYHLQKTTDPACVPQVFRCLGHPSEAVRQQARNAVHCFGWDKVSDAAEGLARRSDGAGIAAVLDGLAAFEAHPQIVALLDRLLVLLNGDLRNRTLLLLERKRLGLDLDAVAALFRDIKSPYRIKKALGQGLFAAAYLAQADGTDLAVVVRVLRTELVGQPHLRARFLDVNSKALHFVHENLVLTREARAFPERSIYFAVRDYVDGVTLQKVLEGGKRFDSGQILRLLRQLLAALGVVHRRGMCHGGIKPSNIFVCEENRVVLGDPSLPLQGIGLALERLSYDYRYAAPETFQGNGTLGPQSDFYALGCVAYELACGEPPFVSDNYLELAARHAHEAVVPPSQRGSRLGPLGDELLLKLLARSPAARPARATEVLRALDMLEAPGALPGEVALRFPAAPLLRDASLARLRDAESVLGFDASAASLVPRPEDTLSSCMPGVWSAPQRPERIGDYDILESIGRGGMGIVYKARDRRLDRTVALKMLSSHVTGHSLHLSGEALIRFENEARAVARLQHPHIVQIYDIGEYEGLPYVALEFVGGGTLAEKLRKEMPAPRAAAETVAKLARAVQHAHDQGVLHRDLKPSNVLLTPDGEPKITDFGLAKMLEAPNEDAFTTRVGQIIGTPAYMSPEQAAGNTKAIGPATDIYGLGAILYHSLTGRPPFLGASASQTLQLLVTDQVVSPHALNPAVDRALSAICIRCMAKDPQNRYAAAGELAEDLKRWLQGAPIQANRATNLSRFAQWCRESFAGLFLPRKPK